MSRLLRLLGAFVPAIFSFAASQALADQVTFPLRASDDGRHLVDAADRPFFYQADTPWMMLFNLTLPEATEYMADRKTKGFTALQIMMTGFLGMKNREGQLPFDEAHDLAKPNERFFAHADQVIQKAADMGLYLTIAPMWSGNQTEGWDGKEKDGRPKPLNAAGPEKAAAWGTWLGTRYAKHKHIGWLMGGDRNPYESRELIKTMARAIHAAAPQQLMAAHNASGHASALFYDDEPWLTWNAAYTYEEVFRHVLGEWQRKKMVRPVFLSESGYEHESNDGRGGAPHRLRRQAYGSILSGAVAGHAYGHRDLWRVNEKWRIGLQDPGGRQMSHVATFFRALAWWKLVPEAAENLVTNGRGTVGANDFVTAARASDGSFAVVYLPVARPVKVQLSDFKGPVKVNWFDPTDGSFSEAGEHANQSEREFTPSEKNAAGESDWIMLISAIQ